MVSHCKKLTDDKKIKSGLPTSKKNNVAQFKSGVLIETFYMLRRIVYPARERAANRPKSVRFRAPLRVLSHSHPPRPLDDRRRVSMMVRRCCDNEKFRKAKKREMEIGPRRLLSHQFTCAVAARSLAEQTIVTKVCGCVCVMTSFPVNQNGNIGKVYNTLR